MKVLLALLTLHIESVRSVEASVEHIGTKWLFIPEYCAPQRGMF
jgi:hypothetical protein